MDNLTDEFENYAYDYSDYIGFEDTAGHDDVQWEAAHLIAVVVYSVSFVLGLIGNGTVIWVLLYKMKLSVSTLWLLNLAVADFVFVLFLPFSIDYLLSNLHWKFGVAMCKASSYVSVINMYASVLFITVLSLDRYISLVHVSWSQRFHTMARARITCALVWTCAATFSIPALVFRDVDELHSKMVCYNNFGTDHHVAMVRHVTIVAIRTTVGFLLPFTATTVTGLLLAVRARTPGGIRISSFSRTVLAVILTFFLCWAPFHIFSLMELSTHISLQLITVLKMGFPLASSLAFFNSCVNPLLYVLLSKKVRRILKQSCLNITKHSMRGLTHSISVTEPTSVLVNPSAIQAVEMAVL